MAHDVSLSRSRRFSYASVVWLAIARGLALFIGGFSLLNLAGELRHPGFDANLWWIDLRMLGPQLSQGLLALAGLLLPIWGIRTPRGRAGRGVTAAVTLLLLAAAMGNTLGVRTLADRHIIATGCPISFSLLVAGALVWILVAMETAPRTARSPRWTQTAVIGLTVATCLIGFPLAQMWCFGTTDYRRPADAVVVFGARVYADGGLSLAVADRVRTGCSLYQQGLARKVILSGGPGDGDIHETEGMRRMALRLGVPACDILIDEQGLNTEATVRNTREILAEHGLSRALAVSHFYHLPRIKLTYQRYGRDVYTVPAQETRRLRALPTYMMREIAALLLYYVRPVP
jgi:uncharacterized SAM-binding protein YcdF (DUF218 family)